MPGVISLQDLRSFSFCLTDGGGHWKLSHVPAFFAAVTATVNESVRTRLRLTSSSGVAERAKVIGGIADDVD
jgi:hypothetical protein